MTMTHFELVGEFHTVFDYPVRTEPYLEVFEKEPKLLKSRSAFMWEEEDEFSVAFDDSDMIEMADALADINYFAYGSGQCLGINLDQRLLDAGFGHITSRPSVLLEDVLDTDVDPVFLETRHHEINVKLIMIREHLKEFDEAVENEDFEGLVTSLTHVIIAVNRLGYFLHFDMDAMFREVHRSNMTKVCHSIEDAEESVRRYLEEGRYKRPVIRAKGQYYMVYDEDLNKILKNYKWENPNLPQFMGPKFLKIKLKSAQ